MPTTTQPRLVAAKVAARLLNCGSATIWRNVRNGVLPSLKVNSRRLIFVRPNP